MSWWELQSYSEGKKINTPNHVFHIVSLHPV